ncbi:MAG: hypothetical protein FWG73_09265, partial [Planctomycetaceae bacterium]|nr:hypothetical protein [Planctomycetaceae bacterium]
PPPPPPYFFLREQREGLYKGEIVHSFECFRVLTTILTDYSTSAMGKSQEKKIYNLDLSGQGQNFCSWKYPK